MANYWGKSPLRMECPHCGVRDEHPVARTDPTNYHWSDELAPLFERLVGRDISYRRRTKRCKNCDREFLTVEMANTYLRGLVNEVLRLTAECERTAAALAEAELNVVRLQQAINEAAGVLVPVRTKQLIRRSTRRAQKQRAPASSTR